MSNTDPATIAISLADALPREADRRDELIAIGMLTTGLICESPCENERAELVEAFCNILRGCIVQRLN